MKSGDQRSLGHDARWYAVNVYSGFENKVAEGIREQVDKRGLQHLIQDVFIPKEDVVEIKRGSKVNVERKFFPGYVLIKMILTDELWHLIQDMPKVARFLGSGKGGPFPIPQKEVDRVLTEVSERLESPRSLVFYEVGELVYVCADPFNDFEGVVEEVDHEKSRLKVEVKIFGRSTPVVLDFTQVKKKA